MAKILKKRTQIFLTFFSFIGLLTFLASCTAKQGKIEPKELRVFTWSSYVLPQVVERFEKAHNAKVKVDFYSSNEELLAKLSSTIQAAGRGYDVIYPSDYMVSTLKKLGYLQALDHSRLPVLKEFEESFRNPNYDKGLLHSLPFSFGTTGIAVNTKLVKDFDASKGVSWLDLLDTKTYSKKNTLLDDSKEVFHAALITLGKNWATANDADLKAAFEYLKARKKNIAMFTVETRPVLENSECAFCQAYSGDALQVAATHPEIVYMIPKEGATIWADNMAIPTNAREVELAHAFINEMVSAENAKLFAENSFFASPNKVGMANVDPRLKSNPAFMPSADAQKRLRFLEDRPEILPLIDKYWTELRAL